MNLINLCADLSAKLLPTDISTVELPLALLGAFRRKSISFFNGQTDEKTIVYWFQSKSFTIDLRLKDIELTPVLQRQGWLGQTLWDREQQVLSWQVDSNSNYQNHIQWPEPATLHCIGNCILEFSPSNAYVEDWRQQANQGLYLGLRLEKAVHLKSNASVQLDAGLIICGDLVAYAQSRLPQNQQAILPFSNLIEAHQAGIDLEQINQLEVSVGSLSSGVQFSTQNHRLQQLFSLEGFEYIGENQLKQVKEIEGKTYALYFKIDIYQPHYQFQTQTSTTAASHTWLTQEAEHLLHHAQATY
ncbi:hypothetical protein [Acinetobacter tandoii]|uniref:Uncharacterized protein n=1 Tax=Acinetobacter tandoii DSM 14970 = CIP 107469 TaxID=1120927 RepID=R9AXE0_9GAMM|nr:hypothetical protein [Acinetobacter tandoii]EOR06685.1 hypothetical protein I593_02554 [Acinetobacter tandoii DSM 14970 = CIP 107469]